MGVVDNSGWLAAIIATGVTIGLRALDYFLPKGYMFRWTKEHSVKKEEEKKDE